MCIDGSCSRLYFGVVNPFNVGVAQGIAGLPMFSGIGLRIVIWIATVILVLIYISRYAKKVKEDPKNSLIYDIEQKEKSTILDLETIEPLTKQILVLIIFALGMITLLIGVFNFDWYLTEISAVFCNGYYFRFGIWHKTK